MQKGQYSPHLHISSALFLGGLITIRQGIAAIFGWVLSSAFSILTNMGLEVPLGGIGHDALAPNKLVETGMVSGQGVSSLVCRAVAVAVAVALGCYTLGGLPPLGMEGPSSPWNLLIGGLGIS